MALVKDDGVPDVIKEGLHLYHPIPGQIGMPVAPFFPTDIVAERNSPFRDIKNATIRRIAEQQELNNRNDNPNDDISPITGIRRKAVNLNNAESIINYHNFVAESVAPFDPSETNQNEDIEQAKEANVKIAWDGTNPNDITMFVNPDYIPFFFERYTLSKDDRTGLVYWRPKADKNAAYAKVLEEALIDNRAFDQRDPEIINARNQVLGEDSAQSNPSVSERVRAGKTDFDALIRENDQGDSNAVILMNSAMSGITSYEGKRLGVIRREAETQASLLLATLKKLQAEENRVLSPGFGVTEKELFHRDPSLLANAITAVQDNVAQSQDLGLIGRANPEEVLKQMAPRLATVGIDIEQLLKEAREIYGAAEQVSPGSPGGQFVPTRPLQDVSFQERSIPGVPGPELVPVEEDRFVPPSVIDAAVRSMKEGLVDELRNGRGNAEEKSALLNSVLGVVRGVEKDAQGNYIDTAPGGLDLEKALNLSYAAYQEGRMTYAEMASNLQNWVRINNDQFKIREAQREAQRKSRIAAREDFEAGRQARGKSMAELAIGEETATSDFVLNLIAQQKGLPPIGVGKKIGGAQYYEQMAETYGMPAPEFPEVGVARTYVPDYRTAFEEARQQIQQAYPHTDEETFVRERIT